MRSSGNVRTGNVGRITAIDVNHLRLAVGYGLSCRVNQNCFVRINSNAWPLTFFGVHFFFLHWMQWCGLLSSDVLSISHWTHEYAEVHFIFVLISAELPSQDLFKFLDFVLFGMGYSPFYMDWRPLSSIFCSFL